MTTSFRSNVWLHFFWQRLGSIATSALALGATLALRGAVIGAAAGVMLSLQEAQSFEMTVYTSPPWALYTAVAAGKFTFAAGAIFGGIWGFLLHGNPVFEYRFRALARGAARGMLIGSFIGIYGGMLLGWMLTTLGYDVPGFTGDWDPSPHGCLLGLLTGGTAGAVLGSWTHASGFTPNELRRRLRPVEPLAAPLSYWFSPYGMYRTYPLRRLVRDACAGAALGIGIGVAAVGLLNWFDAAGVSFDRHTLQPTFIWGIATGSGLGILVGAWGYLRGMPFMRWRRRRLLPQRLRGRAVRLIDRWETRLKSRRFPKAPTSTRRPRFLRCDPRRLVPLRYIPPIGFFRTLMLIAVFSGRGWASKTNTWVELLGVVWGNLQIPIGCACLGWLCGWVWKPVEKARARRANPRDRSNFLLNLLCFCFPPLGLLVWLTLDRVRPRLAGGAARSAVRSAVLIYAIYDFLLLPMLVHVAITAMGYARLTPNDPVKVGHRIEQKRLAWYHRHGLPPPRGRDNFTTDPDLTMLQYVWQLTLQRPWK